MCRQVQSALQESVGRTAVTFEAVVTVAVIAARNRVTKPTLRSGVARNSNRDGMIGDGVRYLLRRLQCTETGEERSEVGRVDRTPPTAPSSRRDGPARRHAPCQGHEVRASSDRGGGDDALVLIAVHASEHVDGRSG